MSQTRVNHPGYYGVIVGAALPWYTGLGLLFLTYGEKIASNPDYDIATRYVPIQTWGVIYVVLGLSLFTVATVARVPHRYVRVLMGVGWCLTWFFEITFVITLATDGLFTPTIVAAWGTILIVEFKAIIEPERNPLSTHRRR